MPAEPTIVIVEDDPASVLLLQVLLTNAGFTVCAAKSAEEALSYVRESSPELVLTDIRLPRMSGLDLIRAIKGDPATGSVKFIAVSAHAMPEEISSALAAGCDAYVAKPINNSELLETIDRILEAGVGAEGAA